METYFNIRYEFDRERIFRCIDGVLLSGEREYVCVADGNVLAEAQHNREYRNVLNHALLTICDSGWVPVYLKWLLRIDRPQYCGYQIFWDIVGMKKYSMMFLGGDRNTLDSLRNALMKEDPRVERMPFLELPFCGVDDFDYETIAGQVNDCGPDIIWVSLGAPKQEIFMNRLRPFMRKGVMISVGAVFNFAAGLQIRRAPDWMVACKLEFLHRIFSEPRKQIKRCMKIITTLPGIFIREKLRQQAAKPAFPSFSSKTGRPSCPCTLISCFGKSPDNLDDLLAGWGREHDKRFIIFSDDARFWKLPGNIRLVPMAFCELQELIVKKLGRRNVINTPEELPLLSPKYPLLFKDYIPGISEIATLSLEKNMHG